MARRSSSKDDLKGFPEFGVKRDFICELFTPPLPKSTFYDRVKEGKIIPMKELPGYFKLNASLARLGLPLLKQLPARSEVPSLEDIVRLAFSLIDPVIFPSPSWIGMVESIDSKDIEHARSIAGQHCERVSGYGSIECKLAYLQGALDYVAMMESCV